MSLSKVKSCMNLRFSCQQNSFKYSWRYLSLISWYKFRKRDLALAMEICTQGRTLGASFPGTTFLSTFWTTFSRSTCDLEASTTAVVSGLTLPLTVLLTVSAFRLSKTFIFMWFIFLGLSVFFFGVHSLLSTITRTFCLRWLPVPRLSFSSLTSESEFSAVMKHSSSSMVSFNSYLSSLKPMTLRIL